MDNDRLDSTVSKVTGFFIRQTLLLNGLMVHRSINFECLHLLNNDGNKQKKTYQRTQYSSLNLQYQ